MGATVEFKVHFRTGARGRRRMRPGAKPKPAEVTPGRVPRISRLMALAIHFEDLIKRGVVRDYAEIARLGNVSRARVSQIMDLISLAPDIVESIVFLPKTFTGRDGVTERQLRQVVTQADWAQQRRQWKRISVEQDDPVDPPLEMAPSFSTAEFRSGSDRNVTALHSREPVSPRGLHSPA